ncbi:MAG: hypothetical protein K9J79_03850, partial [Desulfobacteraceae bacterium]|nr:hypothetical protein [Desulfobacteraceae bacterium]
MADHRLQIVLSGKDATRKAFRSATARLKGFTKSVVNMRTAMVGAAGAAGIGYMINRQIDLADQIAKTADSIGVSTDALQEYRYIAERSGVQTNKLDQSFKKFASRVSDLETGSGPLINRLEGVNDETLEMIKNADSTSEALDIVFERMKEYEGQTDQIRIATAAFGREQAAIMTNMVANIESLRERYRELGLEIDHELLRGAESARDAIDDLSKIISRSLTVATLELAPEIERAASGMANWVASNKTFLTQDIPDQIEDIGESIGEIKKIYDALPEGVVGAAGVGLVGRIIGGGKFGLIGGMLYMLNEQLKSFDLDLGQIIESSKDFGEIWAATMRGEKWDPGGNKDKDPMHKATVSLEGLNEELEKARDNATKLEDITVTAERITSTISPKTEKPETIDAPISPDLFRYGEKLFERTRTPLERMQAEIDRITKAWDAGVISQETYMRAIQQTGKKYVNVMDEMEGETEKTFNYMEEFSKMTARNMQSNFSDLFYDAFTGSLDSAEDYFKDFGKSLLRIWADVEA